MAEVQILEPTKVGPHPLVAVRNLQPSQLQIQVLQVPQVPQGLLQVPPVLPVLEEIITPIMFKLCHIPFVIIWDLSRGEFLPLLLGKFLLHIIKMFHLYCKVICFFDQNSSIINQLEDIFFWNSDIVLSVDKYQLLLFVKG